MRLSSVLCALSVYAALAGCTNHPQEPAYSAPGGPPAPKPAPQSNAAPPDIFNILVDGKMYNHMDDARRAMNEQDTRTLARIVPAQAPRFGTLLIIAPAVHTPALMVPSATPEYRAKFTDFMTFLDGHNYEVNAASLRKSNNFAKVVLERAAEGGSVSEPAARGDADFTIWCQESNGKRSCQIKGRDGGSSLLAADLGRGSPEDNSTLIAEVSAQAERLGGH